MHWRSDLSCWGNFKEQLQFGKRRSYATYLFGWTQVKKGSRHLVFYCFFFFHLLLIIVIVQNYHFCHFWTILNKSYNWNWWKKTKAKNSSLISASLQINVEKFSGMKKKFLMEIYDWKSDISFHSQILRNNSHSLSKFHSWVTLMLFAMQNADRIFIFLAETAKTWQGREDVWKEKS